MPTKRRSRRTASRTISAPSVPRWARRWPGVRTSSTSTPSDLELHERDQHRGLARIGVIRLCAKLAAQEALFEPTLHPIAERDEQRAGDGGGCAAHRHGGECRDDDAGVDRMPDDG